MHKVLLSLASNYDQEKNLSEARRRLEQILGHITYTRECWTEPIGSTKRPDKYLNQLASGFTLQSVEQLCRQLKQTELLMGRTTENRKKGIVCIDLDLLLYDDDRYHLADWERSYIKQLMNSEQ